MSDFVTQLRTTNVIDSAAAHGSFYRLREVLDAAGLTQLLKGRGPYTLFAPTDGAFGKLPEGTLESWLKPENKADLISVLSYHIFAGRASAADVSTMSHPRMMGGMSTRIDMDGDRYTIDGAHMIGVEIISTNGVIHAIDAVMLPPDQPKT